MDNYLDKHRGDGYFTQRIRPRTAFRFALLLGFILATPLCAGTARLIQEDRVTALGDRIPILLHLPDPGASPEPPPHPLLILMHGFMRDYGRQIDKATRYARDGLVVLTPDLTNAEPAQTDYGRAVANTIDMVYWLRARTQDPADPLYGLIDPARLALAGHSAGGAIALAAAAMLQAQGQGPSALVLLDAVPYASTLALARRLRPLPVLSSRAEPGACNAWDSVDGLMTALPFAATDLRIVAATHCDPEGPTDPVCQLACGGGSANNRGLFAELNWRFLRETLGMIVPPDEPDFATALRALEQAGRIVILSSAWPATPAEVR